MSANPQYVGWYGHGRRQDWTTPRDLFDSLHAEYRFTLDGASEPGNGLLPKASTADRPIPWTGERVFCNPPWSDIMPFVEMAAAADLAVLLVPARTNVKWFHRALELGAVPRYFKKRPKFGNAAHVGKGHNSPVDCLLLIFGATHAGSAKVPEGHVAVERNLLTAVIEYPELRIYIGSELYDALKAMLAAAPSHTDEEGE